MRRTFCVVSSAVVLILAGCISPASVHEKLGDLHSASYGLDFLVRSEGGRHCELPVVLYLGRGDQPGADGADLQARLGAESITVHAGAKGLYDHETFQSKVQPDRQGPWLVYRVPSEALPPQPFVVWLASECDVQLAFPLREARGNDQPRLYPYIRVGDVN